MRILLPALLLLLLLSGCTTVDGEPVASESVAADAATWNPRTGYADKKYLRPIGQKQGKSADEIAAELEKASTPEMTSSLRETVMNTPWGSHKQLKLIEVFGFLSVSVTDTTGAVGERDMGSLRHALVRSFENDFGTLAFNDLYRKAVDRGTFSHSPIYPKGKALPSPDEVSWRKWLLDYVLKIEFQNKEDAKHIGYIDCLVKTAGKEYGVAYNVSCYAGNLVFMNISWRGEALGLAKHYELTSLISEDLKKLVQQFAVEYFRAKSEP